MTMIVVLYDPDPTYTNKTPRTNPEDPCGRVFCGNALLNLAQTRSSQTDELAPAAIIQRDAQKRHLSKILSAQRFGAG